MTTKRKSICFKWGHGIKIELKGFNNKPPFRVAQALSRKPTLRALSLTLRSLGGSKLQRELVNILKMKVDSKQMQITMTVEVNKT